MLKLAHRIYQPDAGGKCYVPLDAAWGMENQFTTVEVRDAALYAVALGTPQETEALLAKCALFQPSATAIKRMAKQMGGPVQRVLSDRLSSEHCYAIAPSIVRVAERGTVKLVSSDPADAPVIDVDYMACDADINAMLAAIKLCRDLVAGFARIRTFAARSLKSCDFSYNRMPLSFRIEVLNGVDQRPDRDDR